MNLLDLDQLFYTCPYPVKYDGDEYTFRTDHDIVYAVDFKEELSFAPIPAYWFDLTNRSHRPSPNDPKVRETVIRIIGDEPRRCRRAADCLTLSRSAALKNPQKTVRMSGKTLSLHHRNQLT